MHKHKDKDIEIEAKDLPKMLENLEEGFYAIPIFQREFVWDIGNIKSLWDSIYRHYPIGSFLIWETEEKLPKHRDLLGIKLKENTKGNFNYILDGQQRITSLLGSMKGAERSKTKTFTIYFDLRKALNEDVQHDIKIDDTPFLSEDEFKEASEDEKKNIIPVSSLVHFDASLYRDFLLREEKKEIAEFYRVVCDRLKSKYKLSVIHLSKMPIEEVCDIFTRVNQKGKKLTLVELITAKTYKQGSDGDDGFYLRDMLDELNKDLDSYINNFSDAIDESLFLRIISVTNTKTCREKELLSLSAETIMALWDESQEAFRKAIKHLKDELRITSPHLIPYPPMLVPLSYFFRQLKNKPLLDETKEILNSWFWNNSFSGNYQGATNEKINQDCLWFDRVLTGQSKHSVKLSRQINASDIAEQELNLNNAFCKAILCVLSYLQPKDFFTHAQIDINEIFIKRKKDQLHHVFPVKSKIGKRYRRKLINSISNVCFLPRDTNQSISNKNPDDYFSDAKRKNKHFHEDTQTHLIPLDDAFCNKYENFLKNRSVLILEEIKKLVTFGANVDEGETGMDFSTVDELFDEIKKAIYEFGQDVTAKQNKSYIAFKRKYDFVRSDIRNSQIKSWFKMPKGILDDSRKMVRDVSREERQAIGTYEVKFSSRDDLPYVLSLFKQAYNASEPENKYNLEFHLDKIQKPDIVEKLTILRNGINGIGDGFTEHFTKNCIKYKGRHNFCSIYIQKNNFWVDVKINRDELTPASLDVRNHKNKVWSHIRFTADTDIDELGTGQFKIDS